MIGMKELYEKVAADPALQKQLAEILAAAEEKGTEATEAELLAFAKEQGGAVTIEEMRAFFEGLETSHELGEEELDTVAGGKTGGDVALLTFASIVSCGFACISISITAAGKLEHCADAI